MHAQTGPGTPAGAPSEIPRRRTTILLLSALLLYTALADTFKASRKLFWFDEICTISVASRHTLSAIRDALHTGADANPPLFHYLEALTSHAVSNAQIGYRLDSIAGVLCLSLCLFVFVRSGAGDAAGLIAAVFPLLTSIGTVYAIEARPYGMVLGCLGIALLAWRKAESPRGAVALGLSLALAVSLHYYAILAFIPFAAGTAVRWLRTGRFRAAPWAALFLGAVPLAPLWPLLAFVKSYYGAHFWGRPQLLRIPAYYDSNAGLSDGAGAGLAVALGIGLLVVLATTFRGTRKPSAGVTAEEYTVALTLLLLPFAGYAVSAAMHGGFAPRYALASVAGLALGAAYLAVWAGRRTVMLLLSFLGAMLGFREARYWTTDARGPAPISAVQGDVLQTAASTSLPLVISNPFDYVTLAYYDHGRKQFLALVDSEGAARFVHANSNELTIAALQRLMPFDVRPWREFAMQHSRFLLYSRSGDPWNWWPDRLRADGDTLQPVLVHQDQTLFLVESKSSQPDR